MGCLVSKDEWFYDAETGRISSLRRLLEGKRVGDVDLKDDDGDTALNMASLFGQYEVTRYLLDNGADVNGTNKERSTALMMATFNGHKQVADMLIARGASVNATNIHEITALIIAAQKGYADIVNTLIDNKANVNASDKNGFTALIIASRNGHIDVAKKLTANGAIVDTLTKNGWNALIYASWKGHIDIVQELIDKHADVNANFSKALQKAAEFGHLDVCRLLLDAGAKITDAVRAGVCAGAGASKSQAQEIQELLASLLDTHQFMGTPVNTVAEDVLAMLDGELFDLTPSGDGPFSAAGGVRSTATAQRPRTEKPHFLQLFEQKAEIDPALKEVDLFDAFDDLSSGVIITSITANDAKLQAKQDQGGRRGEVYTPQEAGGPAAGDTALHFRVRVQSQSRKFLSLRQTGAWPQATNITPLDSGLEPPWNPPVLLIGQCSSPTSAQTSPLPKMRYKPAQAVTPPDSSSMAEQKC